MPQSRTYVPPRDQGRKTIWSANVLLAALNVAFAVLALFMARNHAWTDAFMALVPLPGPSTSFAADPSLARQMQLDSTVVGYRTLADQTSTLVAEAEVSNRSMLAVTKIVLEAHAYGGGLPVATVSAMCGLSVSERFIGRLAREELRALLELEPPSPRPIAPGETVRCQIAFPGLKQTADEVVFRIASVEPFPGHPPPRLLPEE
jgi:hypothetical protein